MRRILNYINPISRLGQKNYSFISPFLATLSVIILIEIVGYYILKNTSETSIFAIFGLLALTIYFSFRDGIRGGFITTTLAIAYYVYIIYTRQYQGQQLESGIETTVLLGLLYYFIAGVIGWLKQRIDTLIENEANEKKRLQTIIQQLPVGIIITDKDGVITQSNKQVETILGRKIVNGTKVGNGTIFKSTQTNKLTDPSHGPLVTALSTGKSSVKKEYVVDREDKRRIQIQVSAAPIHNRQGKIMAAASIISDITAQKEIEERKDDFVNMASHELKTPITSLKLYVDSLLKRLKESKDDRSVKTLQSIKYQTERLQELVSDLLDVSRLQTGKLNFTKEKFRLDELISDTIEELQGTTRNQEIVCAKRTPVTVFADRFRIYQVFTNLITNAVKYSPEEAEITVRVRRDKGKAVVSVKDVGIGIDEEQQKRIFDRLYQVTDPKEKTFPGLGMGLFISKEIIKRHKGSIWVESQKGKGSTFYFSLPLQRTTKKL